ncbi:flagellar motor protein MotB [Alkaliphilus serpentinus]|uniref:OmpA family protein n=1 Tax=Alkaliphilus serpentinus TaxID=1482731 RepID=A0A833HPZ4_9FIRM|nr:flagellar motor protein MotB [Alkaliphilus serpentinus]KAB3531377.1 OmpA family protein [Alkaliphilus serpentinus]
MARRKRASEEKKGAPEWMTTYGDMVTLLLCFFVLLFAFSEIDAMKFQAIIQSFQGSLGILEGGKTIEENDYVDEALVEELTTDQKEELEDFRKLQIRLEEFLEENNLAGDVLVTLETRGLVLRFQDNVLYDSGRAELKQSSKELLTYLSGFMVEPELIEKNVVVEGHTDSDPLLPNARYETNWELSVARAANVVRFMIEEVGLEPQRFSASGYGEYQPVAENDTAENKAKNRRVDLVILKKELELSAP